MSELIQQLRHRLQTYQAVDRWTDSALHNPSLYTGEAAVLIAVTNEINPHIILTKRSEELSSHKGEVALPGGRIDLTDRDLIHTALRESHEEVGLHPDHVEVLGRLDSMVTRFGMKVTPVIGLVPENVELLPNYAEIDAVFKVPLQFLLHDKRLRTDIGTIGGHKVRVPCWEYEGYQIWGVTAVILVMMMNKLFDRGIETGMDKIELLSDGKWVPQDWREVENNKE